MTFEKITIYDNKILSSIAKLHIDGLGYRSFITQFGLEFLIKVYRIILDSQIGFLFCVKEDNSIVGFACIILGSKLLFTNLFKRFYIFIPYLLKSVLLNPKLFYYTIKSPTYLDTPGKNIPCELLVIAIHADYRSQKIGQDLLELAEKELAIKNIDKYKVTVHKEMHRARNFYERNGFSLVDEFTMNKVIWCVYSKNIL